MNLATPSYGWYHWRPRNKKSDPLHSSLWLNHTDICSMDRDSVIQKFFFFWTNLPPISFWLPVVMSFLPWISSSERRQEISTSFNFFLYLIRSKVFVLGFWVQVGTCFRTRDAKLKTKTRPVTWTLKPDAVIQSRT